VKPFSNSRYQQEYQGSFEKATALLWWVGQLLLERIYLSTERFDSWTSTGTSPFHCLYRYSGKRSSSTPTESSMARGIWCAFYYRL